MLNSIAGGNDFVAAYASNGINDEVQSVFYVLEDSPIKSVKDIAGKTIAVNTLGAHLDYTVREALHQNGLPQDAANLVVVPGPQLEQVLRSGQVDIAAFGYWQTTFEGVPQGDGGVRAIFDDTDVLGEIAGGFVVLRRDFVEAHPEAARIFVEQSARAADYAREHPEETTRGPRQDPRGARREPRARPVLPRLRRARGRPAGAARPPVLDRRPRARGQPAQGQAQGRRPAARSQRRTPRRTEAAHDRCANGPPRRGHDP